MTMVKCLGCEVQYDTAVDVHFCPKTISWENYLEQEKKTRSLRKEGIRFACDEIDKKIKKSFMKTADGHRICNLHKVYEFILNLKEANR